MQAKYALFSAYFFWTGDSSAGGDKSGLVPVQVQSFINSVQTETEPSLTQTTETKGKGKENFSRPFFAVSLVGIPAKIRFL